MSKRYFISDPHFGHENMAIRRGFKDADQMGEHIVKMWNSVVSKKDVVYILGDITMEKATQYHWLDRLSGIKIVVLGNHDQRQHTARMMEHVHNVAGVIYLRDKTLDNVILTHVPIHPTELEYRFEYNIHGHVHDKSLDDKRYINVCAEVIDYTPKLLSELIKK